MVELLLDPGYYVRSEIESTRSQTQVFDYYRLLDAVSL